MGGGGRYGTWVNNVKHSLWLRCKCMNCHLMARGSLTRKKNMKRYGEGAAP